MSFANSDKDPLFSPKEKQQYDGDCNFGHSDHYKIGGEITQIIQVKSIHALDTRYEGERKQDR